MIDNISITEKSLNEIKMGFGYPIIDEESSYLLDDQQIKDYIIAPALEHFFNYFPITSNQSIKLSTGAKSTVALPENFFGVLDKRFVPESAGSASSVNGPTGNPFYTQSLITNQGGGYRGDGVFGTPFNFGFSKNTYIKKSYNDALQNNNRVWYSEIDYENNQFIVYASMAGQIDVVWALYTNDFDEACPLRKRQELISFVRSLYKKHIGNMASLQNSGLPEQIDFDRLITDSDDEIERLKTKWANEGRTQAIR